MLYFNFNEGLMRIMLEDELCLDHFISSSSIKNASLAGAVKKCLQCRRDSVSIAVTQCLTLVINSHRLAATFISYLLSSDVTGL